MVDRPDLAEDPGFATILARRDHLDEITAIAHEWCATRPVMEIVGKAQALRVPATPMADAGRLLNDPHLAHRGYFRSSQGKGMPGRPYRWTDPWETCSAPAALDEALAAPPPPAIAPPILTVPAETSASGPLAGLRIIEVTNN